MIGRPFQPGKSGNPGGRPRAVHSIQELARKHAPEAIERLAQIVEKGDSHSAVVAAANAILDRAYKPPQFNTGDASAFKRAVDLSDDELAAIVAKARLTVVKEVQACGQGTQPIHIQLINNNNMV